MVVQLTGQWNILFTDLWGADDGSLPGWSINFDPSLNPPVTVFTPDIGSSSDSSFWDLGDPKYHCKYCRFKFNYG